MQSSRPHSSQPILPRSSTRPFPLFSSSPPSLPCPFSDLYANLLVADTPVPELSTVKACRYIDRLDHISSVLDWNARAISRLAIPPSDIWRRVWRSPLLPRHRETWYKMLLNALPLGTR